MRNARLEEEQASRKQDCWGNINYLRYEDDTTLTEESEEELKILLVKVKEESEKFGLKLNMQKTKIMASGPITSWQIEGGKSGSSDRFSLLGPQNHCRRWLQPWNQKMTASWKENYDKPRQHIKSKDITLPTKVCIVKAMVFPLFMYWCQSWTRKKAEHWGITFEDAWESLV